ncbi:hypothetical protein [Leptolyngbya iicbica]|uniref:Antitoxin n=2 Tax=Cyanophyceae TaxID=3028117 RepID=A0A4Q7EA56_9CYAN|nr:hypothetical protein [Leptolyngbya sp. LK]RZM79777.1 hypothetical protein DYY88_13890 [Leptolyngbya sp. LK]
MEIKIDLPPDLEQSLMYRAAQSKVSLQALILQALRQATQPTTATTSQWSELVLSYEGTPDFPAFEAYREELLPPREPELF